MKKTHSVVSTFVVFVFCCSAELYASPSENEGGDEDKRKLLTMLELQEVDQGRDEDQYDVLKLLSPLLLRGDDEESMVGLYERLVIAVGGYTDHEEVGENRYSNEMSQLREVRSFMRYDLMGSRSDQDAVYRIVGTL